MLANNIIIWIGAMLEFFAAHPYMLIVGRFVVGINCGVNTVVAPMYITELAPISIRGKVGVSHQLAITIALLVSQILGISKVSPHPVSVCEYVWSPTDTRPGGHLLESIVSSYSSVVIVSISDITMVS